VSRADCDALEALLLATAADNLGMAHIFTLHASAREWLRERAHFVGSGDIETEAARRSAEEAAREERVLAARAAGTPVTKESYEAWAARFAAETAPKGPSEAELEKAKRLTGKRWFEARKDKGGDDDGGEDEEVEEAEVDEFDEAAEEEEEEEEEEDDDDYEDEDAVLEKLQKHLHR
jgi:hypothetical protein